MNESLKIILRSPGYDPTPSPSELDRDIAAKRLRCAFASCEVWKVWANMKAKEIVKNLRAK